MRSSDRIVLHRVPVAEAVELECAEAGQGPRPFVLLHGFTGSRDDWREHFEPLSAHGRTLALDQRGHGGATNTGEATGYSLAQLVRDLAAALDQLAATPCDLLGHSMGGMVALRFALAHPERVRSLIVMDTMPGPVSEAESARALFEGLGKLARSRGMAAVAELMAKTAGIGVQAVKAADAYETGSDRVRPKLLQMDPEALAALGQELFVHESVAQRLAEIRCPTTILVGEADAPFRGPSEQMAAAIENARLVVIPEAAHEPQLENPKRWRAAVEAHLVRVRTGD